MWQRGYHISLSTVKDVEDGVADLHCWQQLIREAPYLCPCFYLLGLDMPSGIKIARLCDPKDPRRTRPKCLPALPFSSAQRLSRESMHLQGPRFYRQQK